MFITDDGDYSYVANDIDGTTITAFIETIIAEERAKVFEEERRFILNVLDGIDVADYQMQNKGGGTNAIRFALASRVSPHHQ